MKFHLKLFYCQIMPFFILLLYFCLCKTQKIATQGGLEKISAQFSTADYKYYAGCFSKQFWKTVTANLTSLYILYQPQRIQEECFNSCQDHFQRHSTSELNLIAIHYHICTCVPIYASEKLIRLIQFPDSNCNLKTKDIIIGGTQSLAIYTKTKAYYISYFVSDRQIFEIINENPKRNTDTVVLPTLLDTFYNNRIICPSSCLLPSEIFGSICPDSISSSPDFIQKLKRFLNSYVPESNKNPALCLDYCNSLHPKPDTSDIDPGKPKYIIQSTINKGLPYFDWIELCHCTVKSPRDFLSTMEQNSDEIDDKCYPINLQHRIYGNIPAVHGITSPTSTLKEMTSTTGTPSLEVTSTTGTPALEVEVTITNDTPSLEMTSTTGIPSIKMSTKCLHNKKCKKQDSYGNKWEACSGETIKGNCARAPTPDDQYAYWKCSSDGNFFGEQPDYSNCTSQELLEVEKKYFQYPNNKIGVLQKLRDLVTTDQKTVEYEGAKYYGHDIAKINDIVKRATENNTKSDFTERENITTEAVGVLGNLIATSTPWRQLDIGVRSSNATDVLLSVEQTFFSFASSSMKEISDKSDDEYYEKMVTPINSDPKGFEVTLGIRKKYITKNIKFPAESNSSHIEILQSSRETEDIVFVGMLVKSNYMQNLTSPNSTESNDGTSSKKTFNGKIISLTLSNSSQMATNHALQVRIQIEHDIKAVGKAHMTFRRKLHPGEQAKRVLGETECVYWNTTSLVWSTEGCTKVESLSNSQKTICDCNHLTAFAVLAGHHEYIENDKGLETLTLILCPLSIFCLIATIVILTKMRDLHGERATITKHLCFNLILGNILMLLLVDRKYFYLREEICITVAIATHYIFLCVFGWMAVQGLYLHGRVIVILNTRKDYMPYYTIGAYCYPLIPIGLTVGIGYGIKDNPYGGEMYCWLNGNYIWAFMGPVGVILMGNFIMTVLALKKVRQSQTPKPHRHMKMKYKWKWILGCFTLSALLGLTWVTGYFTLLDEEFSHLMSYVFTIANASQGVFILIFYCLLHERVKPLILKNMGKFGLLLSKDNKLKSEQYKRQTNSTMVLDSEPKQYENQFQRAVPVPMDEEPSHNENSKESSQLTEVDGDEDECQQEEQSGRRTPSVLSISESESEDESGHLCKNLPLESKHLSSDLIFEERISEQSYSDEDEYDTFDEEDPTIRRRRYLCPPYIDELVESDLYLQMSKSDAERSFQE